MHTDNVFKNCVTKFLYQLLLNFIVKIILYRGIPQKRIRKCHTFDIYCIILTVWSCKGPMIETCSHSINISCVWQKIALYIWWGGGGGEQKANTYSKDGCLFRQRTRPDWCDVVTSLQIAVYVTLLYPSFPKSPNTYATSPFGNFQALERYCCV